MEIGDLMRVLWLDEYAKKYQPIFYFVDDLPKTLSRNRIYIIHTAQKSNILNQKIIFGHFFGIDTIQDHSKQLKVTLYDSYGRDNIPQLQLDSGYIIEANKIRYQINYDKTCGFWLLHFMLLRSRGLTLKSIQDHIGYSPSIWNFIPLLISKLLPYESEFHCLKNYQPNFKSRALHDAMNSQPEQSSHLSHGKEEASRTQTENDEGPTGIPSKKSTKSKARQTKEKKPVKKRQVKKEKRQNTTRPNQANGVQKKGSSGGRKAGIVRKVSSKMNGRIPDQTRRLSGSVVPYTIPSFHSRKRAAAVRSKKADFYRSIDVGAGFAAICGLIEAFNRHLDGL